MALQPGSPMVLSMVDYTVMVIPMIIRARTRSPSELSRTRASLARPTNPIQNTKCGYRTLAGDG